MFLNVFIIAIIVLLTLTFAIFTLAVIFPDIVEKLFPGINDIGNYVSSDVSDEELIAIMTSLNCIVHNTLG